jgi:hypothetical protein
VSLLRLANDELRLGRLLGSKVMVGDNISTAACRMGAEVLWRGTAVLVK